MEHWSRYPVVRQVISNMSDRQMQMEKTDRSDLSDQDPTGTYGSGRQGGLAPIELTIVIPTFNERQNIPILIDKLEYTLAGIEWEVIYVDDNSPDGTSDVVRAL